MTKIVPIREKEIEKDGDGEVEDKKDTTELKDTTPTIEEKQLNGFFGSTVSWFTGRYNTFHWLLFIFCLFIFVLIEYESKGNWGWIKKKRLFSNLNLMFFFVFFNIFLLIFFGQFR